MSETLNPATSNRSTSSSGDIPASHTRRVDDEEEAMIRETSGRTFGESFAVFDHATRYWRTSQTTLAWGSDEFSETWPRAGSMQNGVAYRRPTSAPHIFGIESSSSGSSGRRRWPTPRASEWKGTGPIGSASHEHRLLRGYLDATVQEVEGRSGKLNPAWIEWLMGFPIGWTEFEPSAMP